MYKIHAMKIVDIETVARMDALDHDPDPEMGYKKAKEHTLDHLRVVPQHCYVVEDGEGSIIGAMILHPQDEYFEIEDFHVRDIELNKEALSILKKKLIEYLVNVKTEVLCCPFTMRGLLE